ncbi:MAG: GxxExxY protein [Planctomycetota bacterium]
MNENEISRHILNASIEVHRTLGGPGLLESVYEEALAWELRESGFEVRRQYEVPIIYKQNTLGNSLRIDLLINEKVIIECKATARFNDIFEAQTLTYLRRMNLRLDLAINFGERLVKEGFHCFVNGL